MQEKNRPPGWSYNPSSWPQRLPLVGVALIGLATAVYLTLFQIGVIDDIWEPFFGEGSRAVLTSRIARALPIPDASLGAFAYLLDAVAGTIGGARRWATMPWMVILFGIAVGPLGIVSLFLVIAQPLLIGAWCTLCLLSALISVAMIGPAMDEILASLQFLKRVHRSGRSVWHAFWGLGDRPETESLSKAA